MKVFVTLLLFAAITMTIVEAQARGQSHASVGSGKAHGSSAKIGSRNPARNVNIRAHTHNSKTGAIPSHATVNRQRGNNFKPAAKPAVGTKPAMKPIAPKPAAKPAVGIKPAIKPIVSKPAIKPVAEKPAIKPVAEKKPVVTPSVNHGKPASIRDSQQKNTKPENVEPIAKPVVGTPVNAQNDQKIDSKPVSIQDTKDNGNFNTEVKITDGKPVLDLQGNKKIYENKDTRVDLNGAATFRDGKKPEGSLGISGTKNGNSANGEVKFDDKKPSLDLGFTKPIHDSKNANVYLNGAATLREGDKQTGSIGIFGTNNGDSANAQVKFGDGKPALNLNGEKEIINSGDARVSLTGGTTLQKDKKPELSFGIKGTKNSDSVNAGVKIVDGKSTVDVEATKAIFKGNGVDVSLKTGVQHQVGGETQGILKAEGKFK